MGVSLLRALALAAMLAPLLAACGTGGPGDTLSAMNPFKSDSPKVMEQGQTAILQASDPGRGVANRPASIGPATARGDWPQAGGTPTNDPGNVATSLTGMRFWSLRAGSGGSESHLGIGDDNGRIFARPVAAGGIVYVYDTSGTVSAFRIANGGTLWRVSAYPSSKTTKVSGGGLALASGQVLVSTGYGELLSIDAATSTIKWRSSLGGPARSAPAVGGGKVVVTTQTGSVEAFDLATGHQAWKASLDGFSTSLLSSVSPAISDTMVVAAGGGGAIAAFDLNSGNQLWQTSLIGKSNISAFSGLSDVSAGPVVSGDTVYVTGVAGTLLALSAKTGDEVWHIGLGSTDSPIVSGGSLFFVDLQGRLIAADRKSGTINWVTSLPSAAGKGKVAWTGPVMASGTLWVSSSDGRLVAIDATSGTVGTVSGLGFRDDLAPILASGKMLLLSGDGTLVAVN